MKARLLTSMKRSATIAGLVLLVAAPAYAQTGYPPGPASVAMVERVLLDPASPWAASMARDMAAGTPRLESQAILGDLIAQAKLVGAVVPLLQTAYCNLQVYEAQRAAASAR